MLAVPERLMVGRDVDDPPGLQLDDPHVSRVHAMLWREQGGALHSIEDAGSTGGTFVNGRPARAAVLTLNSVVRLGATVLVYDAGDPMEVVRATADRVASHSVPVLLQGDTGTGKELLARRIHQRSGRPGTLVAVNCAALPRELIEAELFGHVQGAFSGAARCREGAFRSAHNGTLLLDEIGELALDAQSKLLRALESQSIRPLGTDHEHPTNVRLIAASNVDLRDAVRRGRFRADLFMRLNGVTLNLPALRERRADISNLVRDLGIEQHTYVEPTPDALEALLLHEWPGNVRELRQLVTRFVSTYAGQQLDLGHLIEFGSDAARVIAERAQRPASQQRISSHRIRRFREPLPGTPDDLRTLLAKNEGNMTRVAEELGISRQHLYRVMTQLGVSAKVARQKPR